VLKNISKIVGIFIIGIVGGIFADQILWPYFVERPLFHQYRLEQSPVYVTERKEITIQENVALKNAIEKVEKAVVGVRTETKSGKILEGSGLIIASDGLLVTLAELIPQGSTFSFFIDDTPYQINGGGQVLKRDLEENLALIKIEEENLPTVSFANLEKMKLGERVFLVGVIFDEGEPSKMVNEGIVKSFDQDFIKTNIFEKNILEGSPLFDIEGNVLGLNTIDKEGKVIAIPISKIKEFAGF
jgi:S1-C subfamily serine protease